MEAYQTWLSDPTPDNMGKLLKDLDPVISAEVSRFNGGPVLKTKARALTLAAVRKYDPSQGAHLKSWVVTQLQPLARYKQGLQPLRPPEAAARKMAEINRMKREFSDSHGRAPTDTELADAVGISVKRINRLENTSRAVMSESALLTRADSGGEPTSLPGMDRPVELGGAAEAVYQGLDERSRFIYDASIGGHGKRQLSGAEIAGRLGVSPAFVSQQRAAVASQIQHAHGLGI